MKNIEVYTLDYCPFCKKALATLTDMGIDFKQTDATMDEENISRVLKQKYNITGEVTYPQIIVDGKRFGGNDTLQESIQNGNFNKVFR